MVEVIWTEPAFNTLDEIAEYISLKNHDAACKLVQQVFQKVNLLEKHPLLGNVPRDLKSTPYRRLFIKPVYVYYRIKESAAVIILYQIKKGLLFAVAVIFSIKG